MRIFFFLLVLFSAKSAIAQRSDGPTEVTSALEKKLRKEVANESLVLKRTLLNEELSSFDIEFSLDTFLIERYMEKYIEYDYSTVGMRNSAYDAAYKYDSLLNKYYKKLLAILKPTDKRSLIQAQKSWIAYRDSELKLIDTLSREEYSGGGTVQGLIDSSLNLELIKERLLKIISHIQRATQEY